MAEQIWPKPFDTAELLKRRASTDRAIKFVRDADGFLSEFLAAERRIIDHFLVFEEARSDLVIAVTARAGLLEALVATLQEKLGME